MTLWTPANLATAAKCWLKADDLGLSNGASVTSWTDSSGNAADATVPGAWYTAPTFQTSILNALAIVRFAAAGTPQNLSATVSAGSTWSAFTVARYITGTHERVISCALDVLSNWFLGWGSNVEDNMYAGSTGPFGPGTTGTTNWHMYVGTVGDPGGKLYSDGSLIGSDVAATNGEGGVLMLAGQYKNSAGPASDCEIAEVLICDYVVSTTYRQLVEGYLAWKWGRQASLVAGHPYANAAPTLDVVSGPHQQAVPFTRGAGGGGKI